MILLILERLDVQAGTVGRSAEHFKQFLAVKYVTEINVTPGGLCL